MKVHYFQRYKQKENVATANTMLLLSRFYQYSSDKFFQFLKKNLLSDSFEPELSFSLQVKQDDSSSVPDAIIEQKSFKIVVETKRSGKSFDEKEIEKQLKRHLKTFNDEKCKVLLTLASTKMRESVENKFKSEIQKYNKESTSPVKHINLTFEQLSQSIQEMLDERDYEMRDILEDYINYCEHDKLFSNGKNWMWVQAVNQTFNFNVENCLYYNKVSVGERPYDYLGLYQDKSVCCIGKVCAKFSGTNLDDIKPIGSSKLTEKYRKKIELAIKDNPALLKEPHYYFFVEQFYETDFKKTSPRALWGMRKFDLTQVLDQKNLPSTEKIAELLKTKTWE